MRFTIAIPRQLKYHLEVDLKNLRMKILFVCHRHPYPPKRGGKIRPFNIIKHWSDQGHEVHVCSLTRTEIEKIEGAGLAQFCSTNFSAPVEPAMQAVRMVSRLATSTPSSMGFFYSPVLRKHITELLAKINFDLIFVHCSSVAQYVAQITSVPKILDYGDIDSQKWLEYVRYKPFPLSAGYWLEGRKLMAAERRLADMFDLCTATTRGELETLREIRPSVNSDWFPNGVDAEFFTPVRSYDPDLISFVGRFDYFPNQEAVKRFVREVFPLVRKQNKNAKFAIVGAEPPQSIKDLADVDGVRVTGTVPDIREFVSSSAVNVANLAIARGTQNKILEAMAMGVPVISSLAAAKGVDAVVGKHLIACDDPDQTAHEILRLMNDKNARDALGYAGRNRVLSNHSWPASMQKLDLIISQKLPNLHTTRLRGVA